MSKRDELVPIDAETLKRYPYFVAWCKEIEHPLEGVLSIEIDAETREVPSDTQWKKFEMTDNYTAGMTFKDGEYLSRPGKWSEGKMLYMPEQAVEEVTK